MHDHLTDSASIHSQKECAHHDVRNDVPPALVKHHQQKALWLLITGDMSQFDPLIGDMSCEMRPPFLIDMYWKVQVYLKKENRLNDALAIAHEYQIAHQNDTDSVKTPALAPLENQNHPEAFDDLFAELVNILGDVHTKLLGLCYALTVSNFHARDEFGSIFYFSCTSVFAHDQLPMLRHELATTCVDYFRNVVIKTLGSPELDEAAQKMVSCMPQQRPDAGAIPVTYSVPRYPAVPAPHWTLNDCDDARGLFYVPDGRGNYVLSGKTTPEQEREPCVVFNCWNTYYKGEDGPGLKAADSTQYYENLSKCDMSWLITTMAAVHQPYPNKCPAACDKHSTAYRDVGMEHRTHFEYSREACAGFDLNQHDPKTHPSLYEECYMAEQVASQSHSIKGAKLLPIGARPGQCYSRTGEAVDFTAEHVRTLSYTQVKQFCTHMMGRHSQSNQPIGQHIVRIGENGASCIDKAFADKLTSIRSTTRRKASYLEEYGQNKVFLTPLELSYS